VKHSRQQPNMQHIIQHDRHLSRASSSLCRIQQGKYEDCLNDFRNICAESQRCLKSCRAITMHHLDLPCCAQCAATAASTREILRALDKGKSGTPIRVAQLVRDLGSYSHVCDWGPMRNKQRLGHGISRVVASGRCKARGGVPVLMMKGRARISALCKHRLDFVSQSLRLARDRVPQHCYRLVWREKRDPNDRCAGPHEISLSSERNVSDRTAQCVEVMNFEATTRARKAGPVSR
jgi:hypothetical protein